MRSANLSDIVDFVNRDDVEHRRIRREMYLSARTLDDLFILGAGFSNNAGLPVQSEFTEKLIHSGTAKDPTRVVVPFLCDFIAKAFGHFETAKSKYWPDLEDIFTCIDLSANTGHHLGVAFPPSELRKVRRALISRIVGMLRAEYENAKKKKLPEWRELDSFFENLDIKRSAFINLNWDTVVEEFIYDVHGPLGFDYECGAKHASFPKSGMRIALDPSPSETKVRIVKMHGSVNWLYCDCCQRLYWFPPRESLQVAQQILRAEEWADIDPEHFRTEWTCLYCSKVPLGTRLATFTYLKALDFPMFQKSWFSAERLLRKAHRWIFIGYSLPAADYEFKYLLKRVQLSRKDQPEIILVSKGPNSKLVYKNYQRFFGLIVERKNFFKNGIDADVLSRLF
jgi:hypothetical protein